VCTKTCPRGEGRPFIPPTELRGILAYFDKLQEREEVTMKLFITLLIISKKEADRYIKRL